MKRSHSGVNHTSTGACVTGDTRPYINGTVHTIKEVFNTAAKRSSKTVDADGGEWYKLKVPLTVNSIDVKSGKMVEATVTRMYRKKVDIKLLKVTLANGTALSCTKKQMLYTRDGWQNSAKYKVGSILAIPKKLIAYEDGDGINGEEVTVECAEILSWQIAEGHEMRKEKIYSLMITQKDTDVLDRLLVLIKIVAD